VTVEQGAVDPASDTLEDFLEFAAAGARLVERGREAYDADEMLRFAAESVLHKIGEAVARLDREAPDLIAAHPEVNWRDMKAIRNLVAHEYAAVDYGIIWNALAEHLPGEAEGVQSILDARHSADGLPSGSVSG